MSISSVSDADSLWIETRAMTGGSRNQAEFSDELGQFFEHLGSLPREIEIEFRGTVYSDRPVNTRKTDPPVEQPIVLLYLPPGFDYSNKVIHFEKQSSSSGTTPQFELEVASLGSDTAGSWKDSSQNSGVTSKTAGGREYGYY